MMKATKSTMPMMLTMMMMMMMMMMMIMMVVVMMILTMILPPIVPSKAKHLNIASSAYGATVCSSSKGAAEAA